MGIAVLRIRVIGEPGSYEPMPEMLLLLILLLQFRGFPYVDCCYKGKPYLFYGCHLFPVWISPVTYLIMEWGKFFFAVGWV